MARAFDIAWAEAIKDVEAEFGERVRVLPQTSAAWRSVGGLDPGRAAREIIGRYHSMPMTTELEGNRDKSKFQGATRLSGAWHNLRISPTQRASLGYPLRQGDKVELLDRPNTPRFTATVVVSTDAGDVKADLIPDGGPTP